jgi:hypothetical protein
MSDIIPAEEAPAPLAAGLADIGAGFGALAVVGLGIYGAVS